jgi:hypothetical protein
MFLLPPRQTEGKGGMKQRAFGHDGLPIGGLTLNTIVRAGREAMAREMRPVHTEETRLWSEREG